MLKIVVGALAGLVVLGALALLAGCATRNSSEREWASAECGQVIDSEARKKCLERVDDEYGRRR